MSQYKNIIDIVERTKELLTEHQSKFEKTLFINCCVGLLVIPNSLIQKSKTELQDRLTPDWGIDPSKIEEMKEPKTIEKIAQHFRNALAHGRIDVVECNPDSFENILIEDKNPQNKQLTFRMLLKFEDFKTFVLKYADTVEYILKNN